MALRIHAYLLAMATHVTLAAEYFGLDSGFLIFAHWAWKWRLLGTGGLASASRAGEILTLGTLIYFICTTQDGLRSTARWRGVRNR